MADYHVRHSEEASSILAGCVIAYNDEDGAPKATTERSSKNPLVKSVVIPRIAKCSKEEETLEQNSHARSTRRPLMIFLRDIAFTPV